MEDKSIMEDKSESMVLCMECDMYKVLPEEKADFTCHKCKLVQLLEEKVRSLEERVSTLKLTRDAEAQTEEPLLIHEEKETPSITIEAAEWKHVTQTRRRCRRLSAPIQLKNQYQVLMQENNEEEHKYTSRSPTRSGPVSTQKPLERRKQTAPEKKKKRRVVVVGDSLLRGTEAAVCRPDITSREVCCLPGARIKDVSERLPRLFRPTDDYPFLLIHIGTNDTATQDIETIYRDFEDLGRKVKELGAQVVFSSILPVDGHGRRRWDKILKVNNWLRRWCYQQGFGFLDHGVSYLYDGLLARDGLHLTRMGKNIFGRRLASLIRRALN